MGISGTPSFVIGLTDAKDSNKVRVTRYIRGAQPLTAFQSAINDQLKLASQGK
jgi:predicted DsbA family dithiol-disulfide isomerase